MPEVYMLMYKQDDDRRFINVGIDKVNGEWRLTGTLEMPISSFEGWVAYLKSRGHEIHIGNLDHARAQRVPVIAVKPGGTWLEAVEGATWVWLKMQTA